MKTVNVNNDAYRVLENEFSKLHLEQYCKLDVLSDLEPLERLAGFLKDCAAILKKKTLFLYNLSHGGFLAKECSTVYNDIYSNVNAHFIEENLINLKVTNVKLNADISTTHTGIVFSEELSSPVIKNIFFNPALLPIVVSKHSYVLGAIYEHIFTFTGTNLVVYVPATLITAFLEEFKSFLEQKNLNYQNLLHLTMIVKNAGDSFESVLTKNLPYIDRWTILDTGSTDNTINVILKVLSGKKGKLYQEPFINFRESRNRCLDLASKDPEPCKYLVMLDDTYVLQGKLREFLNVTRGDQFSESMSIFIKSDDMEYVSNRIIKTKKNLRYIHTLHEVIQPNISVCVQLADAFILDERSDYMEARTMNRKQYDLDQLFSMLEQNPNDSRQLYYIAQTYSLLKNYEKAYEYFLKRVNHTNVGYEQERVDSYFELGRLCNFHLHRDWKESEKFYEEAYSLDKSRPDALYFLGLHYVIDHAAQDSRRAFGYFKKAFECGYPEASQHSLKPTITYRFLLIYLVPLCYELQDFETGWKASTLYVNCGRNVKDDYYMQMLNWINIFSHLLKPIVPISKIGKPYLLFVADGNWQPWSGSDILTKGLGGSETCIVELARYIDKYEVVVFCKCSTPGYFEHVLYRDIKEFHSFIRVNEVDTIIVSRFMEYVMDSMLSNVKNIYLMLHDVVPPNGILPVGEKFKGIFCLTDWHSLRFKPFFPQLHSRTHILGYGIDSTLFKNVNKVPYRFIYSSFPNRGLLPLLQMWSAIKGRYPLATLHVYVDLENDWCKQHHSEQLGLIKTLLNQYENYGVKNFGWVSKMELAAAWCQADVWFYPCCFEETFCLTAYEAAISKTLVVTTALAGLCETVADRGVLLSVNNENNNVTETVLKSKWQADALSALYNVMDNLPEKNRLLNNNYNYTLTQTWLVKAQELQSHITSNVN